MYFSHFNPFEPGRCLTINGTTCNLEINGILDLTQLSKYLFVENVCSLSVSLIGV